MVDFARMQRITTARNKYTHALFLLVIASVILLVGLKYFNLPVQFKLVFVNTEKKENHPPIVFVGGIHRSGTTIMRVLLDVHPMIRCGSEGMVVAPIIDFRYSISARDRSWAKEAGVYPKVLDDAIAVYIRHIVENMGSKAKIVCYKRPELSHYMEYIADILPDSKFVIMLRDGRAVAASTWGQDKLKLPGLSTLEHYMDHWSRGNVDILTACEKVGSKRCIVVRYECLMLDKETQLKRVTEFLNIPWDPVMLNHQAVVKNGTNLNPLEPSSKAASKKLSLDALTKWYTKADNKTRKFFSAPTKKCSLIEKLGYLSLGSPPNYAKLSPIVGNVSSLKIEC